MDLMTGWRKASYSNSGNCVEVASWRKASYSNSGNCVEAGQGQGIVVVRDTRDRDGAMLKLSPQAWALFTSSLR
jgi:Domain of unknown function (DUF397)